MPDYKVARWQLRRNTAERWKILNPVLLEGEQGFELDTGRTKIGDGITPWVSLNYANETNSDAVTFEQLNEHLDDHVNSTNPHPVYDDGPSLLLLYQNAKV